jgi:hypothetical protein
VWVPAPYDRVAWGVTKKVNEKETIPLAELMLVLRGQATAVFARRSGERTMGERQRKREREHS